MPAEHKSKALPLKRPPCLNCKKSWYADRLTNCQTTGCEELEYFLGRARGEEGSDEV